MMLSVHHPLLSCIFSSILATCVYQQARPCLPDPHSSMWLWVDSSLFLTPSQPQFLRLSFAHMTSDFLTVKSQVWETLFSLTSFSLLSLSSLSDILLLGFLVFLSWPSLFWVSFIYFKIFPRPALLTVGLSLGSVVALLFLFLCRFSLHCRDPAQMWWSAASTWVLSVGS